MGLSPLQVNEKLNFITLAQYKVGGILCATTLHQQGLLQNAGTLIITTVAVCVVHSLFLCCSLGVYFINYLHFCIPSKEFTTLKGPL